MFALDARLGVGVVSGNAVGADALQRLVDSVEKSNVKHWCAQGNAAKVSRAVTQRPSAGSALLVRLKGAHSIIVETVPHHDTIVVRARNRDFADRGGLDVVGGPDPKVNLVDIANQAQASHAESLKFV